MGWIRVIYRFLGFILLTLLWAIVFSICRPFYRNKLAAGLQWRMLWLRIAMRLLGIQIDSKGLDNIPKTEAIYVGNHRGYIDPPVALLYAHAVIVAKAEVSGWPLVGYATSLGAVIFVKRTDRGSRTEVLNTMRELLQQKFSLCVFPEGTTSRFPGLLEFRPGAFRLAAELGVPVVPMAIEFEDMRDAWIGKDTFLPHFIRTFRRRHTQVFVHIGKEIRNADGVTLMNECHDWIANELDVLSTCVQRN